ncbi:hypothetical protein POTOM_042893 [Populus tomentosa]|uniref:Zinc-finger domain-containing protein n=1 Tax=Populus tomentosa TaxID=118781 RepID=A0A8X7YQU8_POPTO|nr:hypothetical protein POTOM_042893 [Populus tomentosa]
MSVGCGSGLGGEDGAVTSSNGGGGSGLEEQTGRGASMFGNDGGAFIPAVVRRKVEVGDESEEEEDEKRPANAPLVKVKGVMQIQLSPEASARRCSSKGRGTIYNSVFGICCHFCRQKTLCSEEDCKRCSNLDPDEPCIGKTDCSLCHSPTGVFCRGCLEVRYGEGESFHQKRTSWYKTIYSLCLRKRKMAPTGLAIFKAREMGYKSVAHLVMDELQRRNKLGR